MKLLKFTPIGKSPELFNIDNIKFSYPDGSGTKFTYDYFGKLKPTRVSESYETFLASIQENRPFNIENLVLSILNVDYRAFNIQANLPLKWVVRGEQTSNGTLLYCHGQAISLSDEPIVVRVTETIDEIISLQASLIPLSISSIGGTEYELVISDAGKYLRFFSPNPVSVFVPPHENVPLPIGIPITLEQAGEGVITVMASELPIATINGLPCSGGQYKTLQLIQVEEDTWTCIGGVTPEIQWDYEGVLVAGMVVEEEAIVTGYADTPNFDTLGTINPSPITLSNNRQVNLLVHDNGGGMLGVAGLLALEATESTPEAVGFIQVSIDNTVYEIGESGIVEMVESPFTDGVEYNIKIRVMEQPSNT
jgi:hypothetical protein